MNTLVGFARAYTLITIIRITPPNLSFNKLGGVILINSGWCHCLDMSVVQRLSASQRVLNCRAHDIVIASMHPGSMASSSLY